MSFVSDLINGADNKFDHTSLNALQKVTLRAVVMAFLFYGLAAIEGMIMRTASVIPSIPPVYGSPEHYFSIMTVHPIVGIFWFYLSIGFWCIYVFSPFFN